MTTGRPSGSRLKLTLEMIKFEHTVFALPFALVSALLAARHQGLPRGLPSAAVVAWILVAMVAARSAAMAFNRLVDIRFDAANPRTAGRALPAGLLQTSYVWAFTFVSVGLFVLAAWRLNPLCVVLAPVALIAILGYSLTKRITSLSHIVLGFAIGLSPVGAWIAVTGGLSVVPLLLGVAVMCWIAGFDIIYSLQDVDFDRSQGLHSLPVRLGNRRALVLSRILHVAVVLLLTAVGIGAGLHLAYAAGVILVAGMLAYEHSLVSPTDLSRVNVAFFTMNGWVSITLFCMVVLDRLLSP